jgi:hypothetical protein
MMNQPPRTGRSGERCLVGDRAGHVIGNKTPVAGRVELRVHPHPPAAVMVFDDHVVIVERRLEVASEATPTTSRDSLVSQRRYGEQREVAAAKRILSGNGR